MFSVVFLCVFLLVWIFSFPDLSLLYILLFSSHPFSQFFFLWFLLLIHGFCHFLNSSELILKYCYILFSVCSFVGTFFEQFFLTLSLTSHQSGPFPVAHVWWVWMEQDGFLPSVCGCPPTCGSCEVWKIVFVFEVATKKYSLRSASAGPCSLMWGLPLYRINCVPACSTGILLPAVFPQSGLCPTQRAIFSLWVPNYWEPRLTQNPPISWQPFSLCLWSLGTLHNSEVCKLLLFSPFVPRICLLIYFY